MGWISFSCFHVKESPHYIVKIDCFPLLLPSGEKSKLESIARNIFSQSPNIEILQALEQVDMIKIKENQHQCLCIDTGLYNAVKTKLSITEVDTEHKNLLQVAFWFLYNNFSSEVCIRNNSMKVNGKYHFELVSLRSKTLLKQVYQAYYKFSKKVLTS